MHTHKKITRAAIRGIVALACLSCANAYAVKVKITVTNLAHDGGLWFTPAFFGFHDGSYDLFNDTEAASAAIQTMAETGSPGGLVADLAMYGPMGSMAEVLTGSFGPPGVVFKPGSSESVIVDLDAMYTRFVNYTSMIVPSNDAFLGNDNALELFDDMDNFIGADITIYGADLWDAGTEVNQTAMQSMYGIGSGAAFSALGGMRADEGGSIHAHTGLDAFVGTPLPAMLGDLDYAFGDQTQIASIKFEQVPDSTAYIGWLGAVAIFGFRFVARKRMGAK